MKTCPQCGYERKIKDDHFASPDECPHCGIIYRKWKSREGSTTEAPASSGEALNAVRKGPWGKNNLIVGAALILIVVIVLVNWLLSPGSQSSRQGPVRIESTLPITEPLGMESCSYRICTSAIEKAVVAAGQIFSPPEKTPVLFRVGFLFVQHRFDGGESEIKLQIRLAEWQGSQPAATDLWASDPMVIRGIDKDIHAEWQDSDVPHILLNPAKQYIAWVKLDGLENSSDACIGIPGMGPRYSSALSGRSMANASGTSPYPEGRRVFYRHPLPEEDGVSLTPFGWEIGAAGHNLHFRMSFENRAH